MLIVPDDNGFVRPAAINAAAHTSQNGKRE